MKVSLAKKEMPRSLEAKQKDKAARNALEKNPIFGTCCLVCHKIFAIPGNYKQHVPKCIRLH